MLLIRIITPAPRHAHIGNRHTADRYARLLRSLGHRVIVENQFHEGDRADVLVALHARRSAPSIARFKRLHPDAPLIVVLTGTDVYGSLHLPAARRSLELASRLVTLQPLAIAALPMEHRAKAIVIHQSAQLGTLHALNAVDARSVQSARTFDACVLSHLRPVKDPFRAALAARLVGANSRLRIVHAGAAYTERMAERARREEARNPRYRWLGGLTHGRALRILARSRVLLLTSKSEGGANVISESITLGVPVIASRVAGSVGLLGEDYPGYFPLGDTRALADLLVRAEREPGFLKLLSTHCNRLRGRFTPARERAGWHRLIEAL